MLIEKGDASQSSSQYLQFLESLAALTAGILRKLQPESKGKGEADKTASELTPQEEAATEQICAATLKSTLQDYGSLQQTADGETLSVYQCDRFLVHANLTDGTGFPVYTVSQTDRQPALEVFSFQENPNGNGEFVIYETEGKLTDQQRTNLVKAFKNAYEQEKEGVIQPNGVERVHAQVEALGEFAPKGAHAIVVAEQVLGEKQHFCGKKYAFERKDDGSIDIRSADSEVVRCRMESTGDIQDVQLSADDLQSFQQMHGKLQDAQIVTIDVSYTTVTSTKAGRGIEQER